MQKLNDYDVKKRRRTYIISMGVPPLCARWSMWWKDEQAGLSSGGVGAGCVFGTGVNGVSVGIVGGKQVAGGPCVSYNTQLKVELRGIVRAGARGKWEVDLSDMPKKG